MTTPTPPHQAAIRAAEKMTGNDTSKVFCCYPIGWCDSNELAQIITREYEGVFDSIEEALNAIEGLPVERKHQSVIKFATVELKKALNQLTKDECE